MLHKTQGIVLGTTLYNDTYSLTHVFTRDFGRVTYLLPKAHGRRQKIRTSLFFPLSVLFLEVEHMPLRDIQRLKDAERQFPLYEINTDMTKISLAFFLSEFLSRVLRESDHNDRIFDYLKNSVETLEPPQRGWPTFIWPSWWGLPAIWVCTPMSILWGATAISICSMVSL